jgi:DNA-nicking Smr family endonuclease
MNERRDTEAERLWSLVAATVRPLPGRRVAAAASRPAAAPASTTAAKPLRAAPRQSGRPPREIEPGRRRRIVLERDLVMPRIDLHGLTQDGARAALTRFIQRVSQEGARAALVITGKGALGDGVLRRRAPEWLAEPPLRGLVAGLSEAHRRHGGAGALYVALKRPEPR